MKGWSTSVTYHYLIDFFFHNFHTTWLLLSENFNQIYHKIHLVRIGLCSSLWAGFFKAFLWGNEKFIFSSICLHDHWLTPWFSWYCLYRSSYLIVKPINWLHKFIGICPPVTDTKANTFEWQCLLLYTTSWVPNIDHNAQKVDLWPWPQSKVKGTEQWCPNAILAFDPCMTSTNNHSLARAMVDRHPKNKGSTVQ